MRNSTSAHINANSHYYASVCLNNKDTGKEKNVSVMHNERTVIRLFICQSWIFFNQ